MSTTLKPFQTGFGHDTERDPVQVALESRVLSAERARYILGAAVYVLRAEQATAPVVDVSRAFRPVTAAHVSVAEHMEAASPVAPTNPLEAMVAQHAQPSEVIRNAFEESTRQ